MRALRAPQGKVRNRNPRHPAEIPLFVIGLGNPGLKYERTRHNVGYISVDRLTEEPRLNFRSRLFSSYAEARIENPGAERSILAFRYKGYMNRSGEMMPSLVRRYGISASDIIVIVDNMDLPPGACRLKKGGGHAGHNGLKSLIAFLGSSDFIRLYIGIGRPSPGISVVDHVLGEPEGEDGNAIDFACTRAARAVRDLTAFPFQKVAEGLNRRES